MKQRIAVIAVLIGFSCARVQAAGAPKIQFDRMVYDFGTTSLVQSVTGTFTFHNAGDSELQVQAPKPACGCTVAGVKPDRLKPGEKGEVVFTMNLLAIHGPTQKSIIVPSNDPHQPDLELTIKGDVKPTFEITPKQVTLGDLHVDATTNIAVTVKRVDGRKLAITKVEMSDPAIRTRVESTEGGDQTARFLIEVQGNGAPRWFNGTVQITTADSQGSAFFIPVSARFVGDLVVSPEELAWSVIDDSDPAESAKPEPHTRTVAVYTTRADQKLELRNATSDLKDLSFEIEPVEAGKRYNIVVKLSGLPKQPLTGNIHLETNLPNQPKIVVPVTIKVIKL